MKKSKKNLNKRLPKYVLGTMKPIDLGYQRGRGIGSTKFDTQQNASLEPETQAIRKSALPQSLGYITQQAPFITESLKQYNQQQPSLLGNGVTSVTNAMSGGAEGIIGSGFNVAAANLPSNTIQWVQPSLENTLALANAPTQTASEAGTNAVSTAGKNVLGTASKVLGGVGSAIGAYTMANQIAGFGDHRSASDMLANVGRSNVTTEYGNQYTTYNGVNSSQELAYEKANARSKQLGFGMNAIGTGASIGSLFSPIGTAIGAAAGLLLGGLGSLFGWGDNSDEIERLTTLSNDNIAMYNRQGEAVARSKDVAAEFNDRQNVLGAADGKSAYGPMKNISKFNNGKKFSVGPHGISSKKGSLLEGQEVDWDTNPKNPEGIIVPGKPNGDTVLSSTTPYNSDVVISNKNPYIEDARKIVKDQDRLNNIITNASGSKKQQALQIRQAEQMKQLNNEKMKVISMYNPANLQQNKYKCGKLPGFSNGIDYLMATIPQLAAFGSNLYQYNRAKYADMPDYPTITESSGASEALNVLRNRRFNPAPILEHIHRTHRNNLYNINRTPGLTAGGQAIARANNTISEAQRGAEVLTQADEINNKYIADYANADLNYNKWLTELLTNNNYNRSIFKQHQNAAKENTRAGYLKNMNTVISDMFKDYFNIRQYHDALALGNKRIGLWEQQNDIDDKKLNAMIAGGMYNNYIPTPGVIPTVNDDETARVLRNNAIKNYYYSFDRSA